MVNSFMNPIQEKSELEESEPKGDETMVRLLMDSDMSRSMKQIKAPHLKVTRERTRKISQNKELEDSAIVDLMSYLEP